MKSHPERHTWRCLQVQIILAPCILINILDINKSTSDIIINSVGHANCYPIICSLRALKVNSFLM